MLLMSRLNNKVGKLNSGICVDPIVFRRFFGYYINVKWRTGMPFLVCV